MKKKCTIVLLLAMCLVPLSGKGQALIALAFGKKLETDRVKLGLFLAEQGSMITGAETIDFNLNLSFSVGAYTDVKLGDKNKWILQNYMVFKAPKGASGLDVKTEALTDDPDVIDGTDVIERDITYFEITPIARYCLTPSWSVGAGPYVGFRMGATDVYSAKRDQGDLSFKMKMKSDYGMVDFGLAFDVQYRFMKGNGLQLGLRYEQGLVDVYKKSTGLSGKNMAFNFGVGIPITHSNKAPASK